MNLTAFNDDELDSPENVVLTLTTPTVTEGGATLVAGDESAQLDITDNDVNVTFAVTVASESTGNDTVNGLAVIAEQDGGDDTGTFTITKGGGALTGANTASVTITVSGTGEDADFTGMSGTDRADIVAAESRRALATTELDRTKALFERGAVPQAELDVRKASFDQAEASLLQAKARLASAEAGP